MRRTILSVLITLMVATPCLSQEVAPDGLFSIEGTRWRSCGVSSSLRFSWDGSGSGFNFNIGCSGNSYGFYEEKVYSCSFDNCFPEENSFYIDTPLVGIACIYPGRELLNVDLFIMQPTGFGVYMRLDQYFRSRFFPPDSYYSGWEMSFGTGILFKVENGWPGSPAFGSISPNQGEQESTLTLEITCANTTFREDGVNAIIFSPDDGLTIRNITIQDNTTVEFNLEIAADAPLGIKSVIVTYDDGTKSIVGSNVFEVLPRSN